MLQLKRLHHTTWSKSQAQCAGMVGYHAFNKDSNIEPYEGVWDSPLGGGDGK